MRRLLAILVALAAPLMACNLSESPTAIPPTLPPAPALSIPVVGLNPVSGPPGTIINVAAAGFPAAAKVNLFLTPVNATAQTPVAQNLTIGPGGILSFAVQLPAELNSTPLSGTVPLNFTIATVDNVTRANAIFIATAGGSGTPTATAVIGGGTTGGATGQLFITSPAIGSTLVGNLVTVTGSGSALNNRVGVQVLDNNNNVLGSALATIQAGPGAVGPWETTITFNQPAAAKPGYIVAYTVNAQGGIADQASIPVTLAGAAVPLTTAVPTILPTTAPNVQPIITVAPPGQGGFITATP